MKPMIKLLNLIFCWSLWTLVQQPVQANFGKNKHGLKLFGSDETDLSIILDSDEVNYCESLLDRSFDKGLKHVHPLKKIFLKKEAKKRRKHMKKLKKLLKKNHKGKSVVELHHYKYPVQYPESIEYSYPAPRYYYQAQPRPYPVSRHYAKPRPPPQPYRAYNSYHSEANQHHNLRPMPQYPAPKPYRRPAEYNLDPCESDPCVEYDPCLET